MKTFIFYYLALLVVILWSCQNDLKHENNTIQKANADTIETEIPSNKFGRPTYDYRAFVKLVAALGLEDISNGYDSIQIRVLRPLKSHKKVQLIVMKKIKGNKWEGVAYNFRVTGSLDSNNIKVTDTARRFLQPQSGWNFFSTTILNLQITSLPDIDKINGYEIGADGDLFTFEIATKKYYRFYQYWEPKSFENKFWQAKNVVKIFELIDKEFNFQ